jgi:dolichyl-diphosphooligosaccharide--protein glycosyltransferase
MIRLMLTLAPIICVIAGIALSEIMSQAGASIRQAFIDSGSSVVKPDESEFQRIEKPEDPKKIANVKKNKDQKPEAASNGDKEKVLKNQGPRLLPFDAALGLMTFVLLILCNQIYHSTLLAAEAYSSPSIIMSHRTQDGRVIIDDYREAYYWLKQNTPPDAKIMSWWDYGY